MSWISLSIDEKWQKGDILCLERAFNDNFSQANVDRVCDHIKEICAYETCCLRETFKPYGFIVDGLEEDYDTPIDWIEDTSIESDDSVFLLRHDGKMRKPVMNQFHAEPIPLP